MTPEAWITLGFGIVGVLGGALMWIITLATTRAILLAHLKDCEQYRKRQDEFYERLDNLVTQLLLERRTLPVP